MRKPITFFLLSLLLLTSCSENRETWMRYNCDETGKIQDTLTVTIESGKLFLQLSPRWAMEGLKAGDNTFDIYDSVKNPADPRQVVYLVRAADGSWLYFRIFRVEKGRAAIDLGPLSHVADNSSSDTPPDIRSKNLFGSQAYPAPFFYSDELVGKWELMPGFDGVNRDSVLYYLKLRNDYFRSHRERFSKWGKAGETYMLEEPSFAALDEAGKNPCLAYAQLVSSGYFKIDDRVSQEQDSLYRAAVFGADAK